MSFALKNRATLVKTSLGEAIMITRLLGVIAAACVGLATGASAQGKAELLWYSQAAFKLTTQTGKVIMIDPWIMGATKIPPELKDLDKIGKVEDIMLDKTSNNIMFAVVGFGGVLGMGEKYHPLPWATPGEVPPPARGRQTGTPRAFRRDGHRPAEVRPRAPPTAGAGST